MLWFNIKPFSGTPESEIVSGSEYLTKAPSIKKAIPNGMAFYYV
jgi:hypothetical protein